MGKVLIINGHSILKRSLTPAVTNHRRPEYLKKSFQKKIKKILSKPYFFSFLNFFKKLKFLALNFLEPKYLSSFKFWKLVSLVKIRKMRNILDSCISFNSRYSIEFNLVVFSWTQFSLYPIFINFLGFTYPTQTLTYPFWRSLLDYWQSLYFFNISLLY